MSGGEGGVGALLEGKDDSDETVHDEKEGDFRGRGMLTN